MLDLVVKDGRAAGIVTRDLITGEVQSRSAHAVVLGTGGYGNVFYLSTNAKACNVTAAWRAHKRGALFANPCFTQIHPTCIPRSDDFQSKLTLMSESLRNDGRVWVPKQLDDTRSPDQIPEDDRDYFLERRYPAFGNLVPRDVASRAIKTEVDAGRGVGPLKNGVYLDFAESIERLGRDVIEERYGNLFEMYERITDENPYKVPMRIYPAIHYTMGGLWVDYDLMSNVPGLYVLGEANFSDHGANRLGRRALMQGLADGYFVLPYTIGDYLAPLLGSRAGADRRPRVHGGRGRRSPTRPQRLLSINGNALGRLLPPRARQDPLGQLRHGPQPSSAREGAHRDPGAPRGVLRRRQGARRARRRSTSRSRRPAASPTSSSSASCCAATRSPRGVVRRPLPRRVPDRGRRGAARRRATSRTSPRGSSTGVGQRTDAPQGAARVRVRPPRPAELQVARVGRACNTMDLTLRVWRQAGPDAPGRVRDLDAPDISPEMSFLEMLDVVNERLDRRRQGADRLRPRLPRGHLRLVLA